jgi:exodeoxyribonuclease III
MLPCNFTGRTHAQPVKIATFNVNGITARLPALLRWLEESRPDIACLQELKAPQERFPGAAIRDAGYGFVWHVRKAGTA